jgi:Ca2+-binding RTX toxin-like protein
MTRRGWALAAVVASVALILPAAASAATVDVIEAWPGYDRLSRLTFAAAPGESNRLTLRIIEAKDDYLTVEVRDEGAPLSTGTACSGGGGAGAPAFCRLHERVNRELCLKGCPPPEYGENWQVSMVVSLGDGDNSLNAAELDPEEPIPMLVTGGPGADWIDTAAGHDSVDPGYGADVVRTGLGNDKVLATAAPDGPDLYDLGEERSGAQDGDELSYAIRTAPVEVRSGEGGGAEEGDELLGVERLVGGSANDRLVGDGGIRRLEGEGGADVLVGGKGKSRIFGGDGGDLLVGGPRRDQLRESEDASSGNDVARGGGGWDLIVLGGGNDRAFAGRGDDRLQGGPGHDELGCGPGLGDTVVHPGPDALRHCEWVIGR